LVLPTPSIDGKIGGGLNKKFCDIKGYSREEGFGDEMFQDITHPGRLGG
jgi:hypothetical protein